MKKAIKKKILRVVDLCIEITDKTRSHAFANLSGHIKGLSVNVFDDGWVSEKEPVYAFHVYYDNPIFPNAEKDLDDAIEKLTAYLDAKIDDEKHEHEGGFENAAV